MALDQSAALDLLGELKLTDVTDRIRVAIETLYQELIDAEATAFIGAGPFERATDRTALRNGTRSRTLTTTTGDLDLRIEEAAAGVVLSGSAGTAPPGRPGTVRGRDGSVRPRRFDPESRRPGEGPRRGHRDLEVGSIADLRGSARAWTQRWRNSVIGFWPCRTSRMCSSTRPTAKRGGGTGSCPRPSSSRSGWPPTGAGKCSASTLVTARTRASRPASCGR